MVTAAIAFSLGASFGFILRGLAMSAADTAEAEHREAMQRRQAHIQSFKIVG